MKKILILAIFMISSLFAINFNTASKEELMKIKGIGPKKAEAIIKYRKTHKINGVEDLKNIPGFGNKTVSKLKKPELKNKFNAKKQNAKSKMNAKKQQAKNKYSAKKNAMKNKFGSKKSEMKNKKQQLKNKYSSKKQNAKSKYQNKKQNLKNKFNSKKSSLKEKAGLFK
ncbi:MAG: helix-hairpin-helix domain-containing protein [Epsilonproteobacteria bacterium]|nr:helix-hairpin-helix domain-containing protein [Campylobacterota bacterium]